uniref:Gag protein n=1 Tax=Ditylenchus dipsaci TaxID=166011 RepID=A0A915D652_9BILA
MTRLFTIFNFVGFSNYTTDQLSSSPPINSLSARQTCFGGPPPEPPPASADSGHHTFGASASSGSPNYDGGTYDIRESPSLFSDAFKLDLHQANDFIKLFKRERNIDLPFEDGQKFLLNLEKTVRLLKNNNQDVQGPTVWLLLERKLKQCEIEKSFLKAIIEKKSQDQAWNTTKFIATLAELVFKKENFRAVCAQVVNDENLSEELDERGRYSQKYADGFAATIKIYESAATKRIQNTDQKPDQMSMDQQRPQQWWPQQFQSPQPVSQHPRTQSRSACSQLLPGNNFQPNLNWQESS